MTLPGAAAVECESPQLPRLGHSVAGGRPAASRAEARLHLRALDPGLGEPGRHRCRAPGPVLLRPHRPQRAAAAAPHRIRPGTPAQRQRRDLQALHGRLPPPPADPVLPGLGRGAAGDQPRPDRRRLLVGAPRRALRARHAEPAGARAAGGYRTLLLHRPPRRADPLPGRPAGDPRGVFRGPGGGRGIRRPMAGAARAQPPRRRLDEPGHGRLPGHPRLGPPAQVPPAPGAAGPRSIPALPARRRPLRRAGRLGRRIPGRGAGLGRQPGPATPRSTPLGLQGGGRLGFNTWLGDPGQDADLLLARQYATARPHEHKEKEHE